MVCLQWQGTEAAAGREGSQGRWGKNRRHAARPRPCAAAVSRPAYRLGNLLWWANHTHNGPDRVSAPHGCPGLKGPLAPGEGSWKSRGTARGFWGAWEVLSGWRRVLSCTDGLRPHLSSTSRARGSEGYPEAAFWNLQHLQMQEPPINETKPASRMARRHHF